MPFAKKVRCVMRRPCQHIQEALLETEGPALWDQEVQEHLRACERCQSLWELHQRATVIGEGLRQERASLPQDEAPQVDWLVQRIESRARHRQGQRAPSSGRFWAWALAALACVALVWQSLPAEVAPVQPLVPTARKGQTPLKRMKQKPIPRQVKVQMAALMRQAYRSLEELDDVLEREPRLPPPLRAEREAIALGRSLERQGFEPTTWLLVMSEPSADQLDPAPIPQTLPKALSSIEALVRAIDDNDEFTSL